MGSLSLWVGHVAKISELLRCTIWLLVEIGELLLLRRSTKIGKVLLLWSGKRVLLLLLLLRLGRLSLGKVGKVLRLRSGKRVLILLWLGRRTLAREVGKVLLL